MKSLGHGAPPKTPLRSLRPCVKFACLASLTHEEGTEGWGYEVKTEGDAFMVALRVYQPDDAAASWEAPVVKRLK